MQLLQSIQESPVLSPVQLQESTSRFLFFYPVGSSAYVLYVITRLLHISLISFIGEYENGSDEEDAAEDIIMKVLKRVNRRGELATFEYVQLAYSHNGIGPRKGL